MVPHVPLQVIGHLVASDVGRLGGVANEMAPTHVLQHLRVNSRGHSINTNQTYVNPNYHLHQRSFLSVCN